MGFLPFETTGADTDDEEEDDDDAFLATAAEEEEDETTAIDEEEEDALPPFARTCVVDPIATVTFSKPFARDFSLGSGTAAAAFFAYDFLVGSDFAASSSSSSSSSSPFSDGVVEVDSMGAPDLPCCPRFATEAEAAAGKTRGWRWADFAADCYSNEE